LSRIETIKNAEFSTRRVFGDIDLQAHRDWEEKVCARAEIESGFAFVE
jgi:diphthamide synthase (EF-2-diphthine--ammonia ligase)